jgi:hypothetical protein
MISRYRRNYDIKHNIGSSYLSIYRIHSGLKYRCHISYHVGYIVHKLYSF